MRTIMIHEVNKRIIKFLRDRVTKTDILTFDDGLYSHWTCRTLINVHFPENRKIFFIPTDAVRKDGSRANMNLTCEEAMVDWFARGNREGYMSWEEIRDLKDMGMEIGGHSHKHVYHYGTEPEEIYENFTKDTKRMDEEFENNLGHKPDTYCLPHNKNQFLQKKVLEGKEIFGGDRLDVREMMGVPGYYHIQRNYYE